MIKMIGEMHSVIIGFFICVVSMVKWLIYKFLNRFFRKRFLNYIDFVDSELHEFSSLNGKIYNCETRIKSNIRNLTLLPFMLIVFFIMYKFTLFDIISKFIP